MQNKFKAALVVFTFTAVVGVGANVSDARQANVELAKFCSDQVTEPFKGKLACIGHNATSKN